MTAELPPENQAPVEPEPGEIQVNSLQELIEKVAQQGFQPIEGDEDAGLAEVLPFPFLAMVGQREMKLALALSLINPLIGGVLLIGPRGTGKTTAVRSLVDLLPDVPRSLCYYGCMPEDIESGGIDAVCPNCAKKYGAGEPLAVMDRVRLVELPLNSRLEEVIGGIDERAALNDRTGIRRGILAQADRNLLYVDEVNLLSDEIVDAILDAASQGHFTVRRGPVSATYSSRLVLVGSMNPEEGRLRPQILDRFGLRLFIRGLEEPDERLEVYRRVQAYLANPRQAVASYAPETEVLREEIQNARELLPEVELPEEVARRGLQLIDHLKVDSLRAEITLFEAARAHAAADGRTKVVPEDLQVVAPMALRLRRSKYMDRFFANQEAEESELLSIVDEMLN
ncbi:MAG: ATP-binding protein [Anaerolineales bacterium]|nr:ATP-binding protein [Anaerolineales bacterium]